MSADGGVMTTERLRRSCAYTKKVGDASFTSENWLDGQCSGE